MQGGLQPDILADLGPKGMVSGILGKATGHPQMEVRHGDSVVHRDWILTDKADLGAVSEALADQPIYIADGHHRYDTALNYRNERRKAAGSFTGQEGFNFVPMFLARIEDPGLTVLPAHRALFNLVDFHPRKFEDDLNRYSGIDSQR